MVLDRESLRNGSFLEAFRNKPDIEWWSEERIERSMHEVLKERVGNEPLWIFAYGSLIFNPLFEVQECSPAMLCGWHRSFCIRLVIARGNPEFPGRMLALEPGGVCEGIALRLREEGLEEELRMVWTREMVGGGYQPGWTKIQLADGRKVRAIFFAADLNSKLYEKQTAPESIAPLIACASGNIGTNQDYVFNLEAALRQYHIVDAGVNDLASRLRTICKTAEVSR